MVFFKIKIARFLKIKLTFYEGGYDFEGCGSLFKIKGIFFKDQDHNQLFLILMTLLKMMVDFPIAIFS